MLLLRDPGAVQRVQDAGLRTLLAQRFAEVADGEDYDPQVFGYFLLAQSGDSAEAIERATGLTLLGAQVGNSGFVPSWECVIDHPDCYELVFVLEDSGRGIVVLLPKQDGSDARLLDLCRRFAVPMPSVP